jgi:hypothetical protein
MAALLGHAAQTSALGGVPHEEAENFRLRDVAGMSAFSLAGIKNALIF